MLFSFSWFFLKLHNACLLPAMEIKDIVEIHKATHLAESWGTNYEMDKIYGLT